MKTETVEDALKCADACRPTLGKATGPMFSKALVILADEVIRLRTPDASREAERRVIEAAKRWAKDYADGDEASHSEQTRMALYHAVGMLGITAPAQKPEPCPHKSLTVGNNCDDCGADMDERGEPSDLIEPKPEGSAQKPEPCPECGGSGFAVHAIDISDPCPKCQPKPEGGAR